MDLNTLRANHIEDYLVQLHTGQWFGWSDAKNKVYANLIIHDNSKDKPTEQECTDGLATLQSDFDTAKAQKVTDKANAKAKLIAGEALTEAEADTIVI